MLKLLLCMILLVTTTDFKLAEGVLQNVCGQYFEWEAEQRAAAARLEAEEESRRNFIEQYTGTIATSIDGMELIRQYPELPTGCEITSLTMVLRYYGFNADKVKLADNYLTRGETGTTDPEYYFWGDPHKTLAYGCYASAIEKAANLYLEDQNADIKGYNYTGADRVTLYAEIYMKNPVIIWVTDGLRQGSLEQVGDYMWLKGNHCVVLYGYNKLTAKVKVMDPIHGDIEYDEELFWERFAENGRRAVVIKALNE